MKISKLEAEGLFLIKREPILDSRGEFERLFGVEELAGPWGMTQVMQVNRSLTRTAGSIRGLHFQLPPYSETKLVLCLQGKVRDYAVDLRRGSKTFLKVFDVELSRENLQGIVIPAGFAHGFQTLEANSELLYFHSGKYRKDSESGLSFFDPALGINLPLEVTECSERDRSFTFLNKDYEGVIV